MQRGQRFLANFLYSLALGKSVLHEVRKDVRKVYKDRYKARARRKCEAALVSSSEDETFGLSDIEELQGPRLLQISRDLATSILACTYRRVGCV